MKRINFIGLEVCDKSQLTDLFDLKAWERVYCDHVTIEFNPSEDSKYLKWVKENEDREIDVRVDKFGYLSTENGTLIAIGVTLPEGVPCKNAQPHITLALSGEGMKPVMSNDIKDWMGYQHAFTLKCKVKVWYRS